MVLRPGFPDVVDERAARLVAGGVVVMALLVAAFGVTAVLVPLAFCFVVRVIAGPRWSPLALLVTRVVVPRLGGPARPVPGPPKRFAQGIGAAVSVSALVLAMAGLPGAARVLAGALVVAAGLEAAFGLCLGCRAFALLMRWGVVPASTCAACNDISARLDAATR